MKKILVVGSQGMAGHMIRKVLMESSTFEVIDISRSSSGERPTYLMDLTDHKELKVILEKEKPDVVVNCAGILNDAAESNPEKSVFVNSFIPHFLASNCERLIHISTDCVFSGSQGNYLEDSPKDGKGFYAESKSLGEVTYGEHLTLRTSIIGPELKSDGCGLLHWFLNQTGQIKGYSEAMWSGVTTLQLAKSIIELIAHPTVTGLVHYTNNTKISKLHLLEMISRIYQKKISIIRYDDYHVDKSFVNTRRELNLKVPEYESMIMELFKFMKLHHSSLYQQYNFG